MITFRGQLLILIALFTLSGTALASFSYTLGPISNISEIYTGESSKVQFSINSTNYLYDGLCAYWLDSGLLSGEYRVIPGQNMTLYATVRAPPEGSGYGNESHTVYVYCYESAYPGDPAKIYKNTSFTLFYDDSRYEARTAINSAQAAINSARSIMNNSRRTLNDAKNIGADAAEAEKKLSSAEKCFKRAQTELSFAYSFFEFSEYNRSTTFARDAKSEADLAKTDADTAYTMAVQAKLIAEAEKSIQTEEQKTFSDSDTAREIYNNGAEEAKSFPGDHEQKSPLPSFELIASLAGFWVAYLLTHRRKKP